MPRNSDAATLMVESYFLRWAGRAINTGGVVALAIAFAVLVCAYQLAVWERTGLGVLVAVVTIVAGQVASRRGNEHWWWFGTSLMAGGYGLACYFVHATYYSTLSVLSSPYLCWLMAVLLSVIATVHGSRNSLLRWLAVPFTLVVVGHVHLAALSSSGTVQLAGATVHISAVSSFAGLVVWAVLAFAYRRMELSYQTESGRAEADSTVWLYRAVHEIYFVLTAISALKLPDYCGTPETAPLWWAVEAPILLAICWGSRYFFKHAMVMAIWGLSVVLLLTSKAEFSAVVRMAVPLSGLGMGLAYRSFTSNWARWQKVTGYAVYFYGAAVAGFFAPLLQLGHWDALPYWMVEAVVLLSLALVLRDRLLQAAGCLVGVLAVGVFGSYWHDWNSLRWGPTMAWSVAIACYALCRVYGIIAGRGGLKQADLVPLPREDMLSVKELRALEFVTGLLGYATLTASIYLLLASPVNTIVWFVESLVLIVYGLRVRKIAHRFSGLVTMGLGCAKVSLADALAADGSVRPGVALAAIGICCIAAGLFYIWEFRKLNRKNPGSSDGDNETPPDDN